MEPTWTNALIFLLGISFFVCLFFISIASEVGTCNEKLLKENKKLKDENKQLKDEISSLKDKVSKAIERLNQ